MYNIIIDGEVVETIHYNNISDVKRYVQQEYEFYGEHPTIKKVK